MTSTIATTFTNNAGSGFVLAAAGDSVFVGADVTLGSTVLHGILGTDSTQHVTVAGTVVGMGSGSDGISLGNNTSSDSAFFVAVVAGGLVQGQDDAISVTGYGAMIENSGTVLGQYGVTLDGDQAAGSSQIINHGLIHAYGDGIYLMGSEAKVITNYGVIEGFGHSIISVEVDKDTVINHGTLIGMVQLGQGDDVLDNRDGMIDGLVYLELGDDRAALGAGEVNVDGGGGFDVLDFRSSAGIRLALDDSFAARGWAAGDTINGFEAIWGSRTGGDKLAGDAVANSLKGYGGTDTLSGGAANDTLVGGKDADVLTGGGGNDHFQFDKLADRGDAIKDFGTGSGNNDVIDIVASGFGGGLAAGGFLNALQFQSRADNHAQDADDRFIFRSTDQTLWFDVDGNGSAAAVMVADLQAGAIVTAGDILLV